MVIIGLTCKIKIKWLKCEFLGDKISNTSTPNWYMHTITFLLVSINIYIKILELWSKFYTKNQYPQDPIMTFNRWNDYLSGMRIITINQGIKTKIIYFTFPKKGFMISVGIKPCLIWIQFLLSFFGLYNGINLVTFLEIRCW